MAGSTILGKLAVFIGADITDFDKKLQSTTRKMERFGKDMDRLGKDLTSKVTAPLAALGAAAVYNVAKFDDSMSRVSALSGATGKDLDSLRELAKKMGSETAHSASASADAMQYLALAGYDTNQILAATPAMLSLASAASMDLATSADIVTDTMSAFQLSADKAGMAADVFALAQAKSNTNVEQLGEAMKYAAPIANSFQQNLQQTTAVLGVFADSGIKGSMAGTTYTSMLSDMKAASKDGALSIGKMSVALYDAAGNARPMADIIEDVEKATHGMSTAQRDAALASIFQERSIKGVNILLATGTKRLRDLEGMLNNSEGAAKKMADTMENNLGGSFRALMSATEGAAISFGEVLAPSISSLADSIKDIMLWFNNLSATTKKWIVVVAGLAAGIGPAAIAIGAITTMIAAMVSPIALVVAGIAALGVGLAYLSSSSVKTVETVNNATKAWEEQKAKVDALEKTLPDLIKRHDELKEKSNKSKEEQDELKTVIQKIADIMPGAISQFDEYGRVMGVSTEKARELMEMQRAMLKIQNRDAIAEQEKNLERLDKRINNFKETIKAAEAEINERKLTVGVDDSKVKFLRNSILDLAEQIAKLQEEKLGTVGILRELKGIPLLVEEGTKKIEEQTTTITEQAKVVSLLARQHELLKEAQTQKDNATTEKDLAAANQRIKSIQKEIDRLNDLGKTIAKISAVGAITLTADLELNLPKLREDQVGADVLKEAQKAFQKATAEATVFGNVFGDIDQKVNTTRSTILALLDQGFKIDSTPVQDLLNVLRQLQVKAEEIRLQKFEIQIESDLQREFEAAAKSAELLSDSTQGLERKVASLQNRIAVLNAKGFDINDASVKDLQTELDEVLKKVREINAAKVDPNLEANVRFDFDGMTAQAEKHGQEAAKKFGAGFFEVTREIEKVEAQISDFEIRGKADGSEVEGLRVQLVALREQANKAIVQKMEVQAPDNLASLTALIGNDVATIEKQIRGAEAAISKLKNVDPVEWNTDKINEYTTLLERMKEKLKVVSTEEYQVNVKSNVIAEFAKIDEKAKLVGPSFDAVAAKTKFLEGVLTNLVGVEGFSANSPFIQGLKLIDEGVTATIFKAEQQFLQLSGLVTSAFSGIGNSIGDALSNLGKGGAALETFFNGILGVVAEFAGTFGQQLIALGVAKMNLDALFAAPGGGAVAIAAGVALVALSKVVSNSLKGGPFGGGGGVPSASGTSSSPSAKMAQLAPLRIIVEGELRGNDMRLMNKKTDYLVNRGIGG